MKYYTLILLLLPLFSMGQQSRKYYHIPDSLSNKDVVLWDEFELFELTDNVRVGIHPKLKVFQAGDIWVIKERKGKLLRVETFVNNSGVYCWLDNRYLLGGDGPIAWFPDKKRAKEILALRKYWVVSRITLLHAQSIPKQAVNDPLKFIKDSHSCFLSNGKDENH
jgi:hypothetical protein